MRDSRPLGGWGIERRRTFWSGGSTNASVTPDTRKRYTDERVQKVGTVNDTPFYSLDLRFSQERAVDDGVL